MKVVTTLRLLSNISKIQFTITKLGESKGLTNFNPNLLRDNRSFLTSIVSKSNQSASDTFLDSPTYERVCSETLDSLCDYFDELTENSTNLSGYDVAYGDGVLTVNLGSKYGTYVINRQSPNKQIWLSSPTSGPKRYDFIGPKTAECGKWIYKHTGESLHGLLQNEIKDILREQSVDFLKLPYSK